MAMAILIDDTRQGRGPGGAEALCWTCTEAYAGKCLFFEPTSDCPWEEKLTVPSKVAVRQVKKETRYQESPEYYPVYKVLECPNYQPSGRKEKELQREQELRQVVKTKQKKKPVPSKRKRKPVPSIESAASRKGPSSCLLCGAPTDNKLFCSDICKAMGAGLKAKGAGR